MPRKLALLTYNIRPGSDLEEYARFTREVDYPVFRQNPHVLEYSCFVIKEFVQGEEQFRHFDLLFLDEWDSFLGGIREDPLIAAHRKEWYERWSDVGTAGSRYSLAEEIWG